MFENFQNTCLKIYELDPARFLSAPGLALQVALKKTKINLDVLTDNDIVINGRKRYQLINMPRYLSICES